MFNEEGLLRIEARTRSRFSRFGRQQENTVSLIKILKDQLGLKIVYDGQDGFLSIPDGKFILDPKGQETYYFFGKLLSQIKRLQKKSGKTSDEIVRRGLRTLAETLQSLSKGKRFKTKDFFGNHVEFSTIKAYCRHLDRDAEMDEVSGSKMISQSR
jgi:hypothetical protein